jgi:hypothetical protein
MNNGLPTVKKLIEPLARKVTVNLKQLQDRGSDVLGHTHDGDCWRTGSDLRANYAGVLQDVAVTPD